MLYVTENRRKTIAAMIAAALTVAIGFGIGRLSDPSSPDLTPQLVAARQQLVRQHAATAAAAGQVADRQRTITQLRSAIARQQAQITLLARHRRGVHPPKRRG
jgi:hypothetical protein